MSLIPVQSILLYFILFFLFIYFIFFFLSQHIFIGEKNIYINSKSGLHFRKRRKKYIQKDMK